MRGFFAPNNGWKRDMTGALLSSGGGSGSAELGQAPAWTCATIAALRSGSGNDDWVPGRRTESAATAQPSRTDSTPYQPKLNGILKLLGELKEENLVDGHGFQCHYHLHTPGLDQLQSAMDKVLALGLRLRMSEMDILVDSASEEISSARPAATATSWPCSASTTGRLTRCTPGA